jgi:hypothetical protein
MRLIATIVDRFMNNLGSLGVACRDDLFENIILASSLKLPLILIMHYAEYPPKKSKKGGEL